MKIFGFLSLFLLIAVSQAFVTPNKPASLAPTIAKSSSNPLQDFFQGLIPPKKDAVTMKPKFEPVIIDQDFRVAALFLSLGVVLDLIPYIQLTLGPLVTVLGALFLFQGFNVRFKFDDSAFELVTGSGKEYDRENVIVGGKNRWETDTIINYDFFPNGWIDGPIGPILVYFKETQTPRETWNEGPGKMANDPEKIASGEAMEGQVHFFPAVCNAKQIRDEFEKRGCKKL
eukprot:CAMPEP_0198298160 /NCGR_PEP_ID=MMETSP1449-20131203/39866_1 /TAXON_ID=420275 /ORGANISM="Attheya septentrionalis, Strain CCMP2084" /LENGTH=228 /DNA_ID=CAMNT_0043999351 /DNA_START=32 /DNA_END=718 /DNA_ORIENTATION=-